VLSEGELSDLVIDGKQPAYGALQSPRCASAEVARHFATGTDGLNNRAVGRTLRNSEVCGLWAMAD